MNEDKELEEAIDNVKFAIGDLKASNYNKTFIQAIETALKSLGITQKNYELAIKQNISYKQNIKDLKENSIPKKKIEDKIKYYISKRDKYEKSTHSCKFSIRMPALQGMNACINKIKVLQELLEDK